MEDRMVALENRGDACQNAIAIAQRCDRRNGEVFPGNQGEGQGGDAR